MCPRHADNQRWNERLIDKQNQASHWLKSWKWTNNIKKKWIDGVKELSNSGRSKLSELLYFMKSFMREVSANSAWKRLTQPRRSAKVSEQILVNSVEKDTTNNKCTHAWSSRPARASKPEGGWGQGNFSLKLMSTFERLSRSWFHLIWMEVYRPPGMCQGCRERSSYRLREKPPRTCGIFQNL